MKNIFRGSFYILLFLAAIEMGLHLSDALPEIDQSNAKVLFEKKEESYKLKSNVRDISFSGSLVSSNEFGFRDKEMSTSADNSKKIAVLGDSWGFGWGLSETESLAKRLGKKAGKETLNFCIPGYNIKDYHYLIKNELPRFHVNEVIILLHLNDILDLDNLRKEFKNEVSYTPKLIKLLIRKILTPIAERLELRNTTAVNYFESLYDKRSKGYKQFTKQIKEIAEQVNSQGLTLKVFILPIPFMDNQKYLLNGINIQLKDLFSSMGIPSFDLSPVYEKIRKSKVTLSPYDPHPNNFAIDLLSSEIVKNL